MLVATVSSLTISTAPLVAIENTEWNSALPNNTLQRHCGEAA